MNTKLIPTAKKLCTAVMKAFPGVIIQKWQYDAGLCLRGFERMFEATGEQAYYDYIKAYMDYFITDEGTINTYNPEVCNIDHINNGKNLFYMYHKTGEEKYKKAIELLASQLKIQPKTPSGAYWHKKIYPNQVWLDGIFMGEPFSAQYALEFGHDEKWEEILTQFTVAERLTYEPRCGLYAHACDETKECFWADPHTGRSLNVWGRSVGWFCMALADTLDFVPENQAEMRRQLIALLNKVMSNVVLYQDEQGLWYQVLDNRRCDNYAEFTCTSMFAYTLNKGIAKGYLDREKYLPYLNKAVNGILTHFVREDGDCVYMTKGCGVAGLGPADNPRRNGTLDYYMSEPIRENDFKGVGPFLILATELVDGVE